MVILIPALGGLIVGPLKYFFAREAKGHGVPEVKSMASSITIGSGGSMGREGPIVLDDIYHSTVQISSLLIECK